MNIHTRSVPQRRESALETVRAMVAEHARKAPDLKLRLAVWMNPTGQVLPVWQNGVELLEVYDGLGVDPQPAFRAANFGGRRGRPPLGLTLTSPAELSLAFRSRHPFVRGLMRRLRSGQAKVVVPPSRRPGDELLEGLLTAANEV